MLAADDEVVEWPLLCRSFLHWMPTLRSEAHLRLHRLQLLPLPLLVLFTGENVSVDEEDDGFDDGG